MRKTRAMRLLERHGIAYTPGEYDSDAAFHTGREAAELLHVDAGEVYKTLVALSDEAGARPLLILIPVLEGLDLKAAARSVGAKRVRMATQREAETLTGLKVGGISPLAVRPARFDVVVDARALLLEVVHISAGQRGIDLALAPAELVAVTNARAVEGITVSAE